MIITTLLENTTSSKEYKNKHGLSLHIKMENHNILFDLGPDDTFIKNAEKLNIDISDVDIAIISHGHKDHGGGLNVFLQHNNKAKIYIQKNAFEPHYTSVFSIIKCFVGVDKKLKTSNRIVLTEDNINIDDNIYLFSNVVAKGLVPSANKCLFKKEGNKYILDDFKHEQNLILKEGNKHVLIAGCSHTGMVNIVNKAEEIIGKDIDTVIGGFHLFNPISKKCESDSKIERLSQSLGVKNSTFYTLHCTGEKPFKSIKRELRSKINYLSTGQIIEL